MRKFTKPLSLLIAKFKVANKAPIVLLWRCQELGQVSELSGAPRVVFQCQCGMKELGGARASGSSGAQPLVAYPLMDCAPILPMYLRKCLLQSLI